MDDIAQTPPIVIKPKVPTLVKIIAILYLVAGIFGAIGAAAFLFVGVGHGVFSPFGNLGVMGAVAALVFAVIAFLISRGLRKGKRWARLVAIVLSIISCIAAIYSFRMGSGHPIFQFVIHLLIVIYLISNRSVKEAFKK